VTRPNQPTRCRADDRADRSARQHIAKRTARPRADRRVRLRIHVLAPSNRPVQVTENLSVFWRETYPKLKQQLQRKYPKHEWR